MLWHEQKWTTLAGMSKDIPVLIPLGSCEQHGHHLPLLVDTIEVTAVAEAVEKNLGDKVLLTPTLWLGSSDHHKDFPGTLSVAPSLFSEMVTSLARSVLRAGFRRMLFINGHGGNEVPAQQALGELVASSDEADAACIAFGSWWKIAQAVMKPEMHGLTTPGMTHACEYETSLMLFLRPELVDVAKIDTQLPQSATQWQSGRWSGGKVSVFHRFATLTGPGHRGKPEVATAEKGKSMFDAVVKEISEFVGDFGRWEMMERIGPV
jgi:creatinine amidohydrolase